MKKQTNLPAGGRKLSLNKKTISNLNSSEMSRLIGGTHQHSWCHCGSLGCGGTRNGNTCYGHNTCYTC